MTFGACRRLERPQKAKQSGSRGIGRMLKVENASRNFGATAALKDFSLAVSPGEIVGLVGANGAGKSTLIRLISGLLTPDSGRLTINGEPVNFASYSRAVAQSIGIRTVFQELSLCTHQTVADNFFIEQPQLAKGLLVFRRGLLSVARASITRIFEDAALPLDVPVGRLSIAERQMVEIARAVSDPRLRLLILDEPTSSLDSRHSDQLLGYVRERAAEGVSFIFVTHKLKEIMRIATRIVVMRNGQTVLERPSCELSFEQLVQAMGGSMDAAKLHRPAKDRDSAQASSLALVSLSTDDPVNALGETITLRGGEIVGIAGLEGNGQKELLRRIYSGRRQSAKTTFPNDSAVSFVSGDRVHEGVFPGLSILHNATIRRIAGKGLLSWLPRRADRASAEQLLTELGVPASRLDRSILDFSGGNQQKALMARPLVAESKCVLLDDPTRGVDIGTKQQIYRLIRAGADRGYLFFWASSENLEYAECDRVLVMRDGVIVEELKGGDVSDERLLAASFGATDTRSGALQPQRKRRRLPAFDIMIFVPFVALAVVYGLIAISSPGVLTPLGLDLILTAAIPLVFVAVAQMFVVSGGQIDLGVGAFASLANVLSGTYLAQNPPLGAGLLVLALLAYVGTGAVITMRRIPSIVVTLGTSFIWLGIAHALLPSPGGAAPEWLTAVFNIDVFEIPPSVIVILVLSALAWLIMRSRLGIVMRGFGDNESAMVQSGWSPIGIQVARFALSGSFTIGAGFAMTALSGGADANSGSTLTLLAVAAIVMGGCSLVGGEVSALGSVAGAVIVSLVGTLLSTYGVSTNYSAAVQGVLLLAILLLQAFRLRAR
jgi:ribose transport system ATP-binding protein